MYGHNAKAVNEFLGHGWRQVTHFFFLQWLIYFEKQQALESQVYIYEIICYVVGYS